MIKKIIKETVWTYDERTLEAILQQIGQFWDSATFVSKIIVNESVVSKEEFLDWARSRLIDGKSVDSDDVLVSAGCAIKELVYHQGYGNQRNYRWVEWKLDIKMEEHERVEEVPD